MSEAPRSSSYLQYLPPILWDYEDDSFIGHFLLGFEKILTGADDGLELCIDVRDDGTRSVRIANASDTLPARSRRYDSIETVIDGLHHLFNPRRTRAEFLNYLASWLAFDAN